MDLNNKKERSKAFWRFIFFFIITVAIMSSTIFLGIRVPYAENKRLKEQLDVVKMEEQFQENFLQTMIQTQSLLDSVNRTPGLAGLIDGRITQNLQTMDAMINSSNSSSKAMYTQIVKQFNFSQSDKAALRAAANKDSLVSMYNAEINKLNGSLNEWKDAYNQLQMKMMILKQNKR